MKILIALRSLRQEEGGPITAAFGLAANLLERGYEVTISAHDDGLGEVIIDSIVAPQGVEIRLFPMTRRAWEHSKEYAAWLTANMATFDVAFVNSLWISHVHYACRAAERSGTPFVIRPHGCLNQADMAHHSLRKRIYLWAEDRKHLRRAAFIHCTSEAESTDARALGFDNVRTIPLGIDADLLTLSSTTRDRRRVLVLGRISEKKGIDILIRALAEPAAVAAGLEVDVVGTDHGNIQSALEDLAGEMGVRSRVHFWGHANRAECRSFFERAGVFALPSKDENFGIAVAEAMATGVPVVITRGVSHAQLVEQYQAGLVVDRSPKAVGRAIAEISTLSPEGYAAMSSHARAAIAENYSWTRTVDELEHALCDSRRQTPLAT